MLFVEMTLSCVPMWDSSVSAILQAVNCLPTLFHPSGIFLKA